MRVSVLFNESKLLKLWERTGCGPIVAGFSTLQRVEIAEIKEKRLTEDERRCFSTLQRVEIAEIDRIGALATLITAFQYSSTSRNC